MPTVRASSRASSWAATAATAPVRIGRGAWIAAGAMVLQGVTVAMDVDLLLFGRIRSGPFFARLEKR